MRKDNMTKEGVDELREEYDFSQGVRGKYAARYSEGISLVLIESETAHWLAEAAKHTLYLVLMRGGRHRKKDYPSIRFRRGDWHAILAHLNKPFDRKEVEKCPPKCYNGSTNQHGSRHRGGPFLTCFAGKLKNRKTAGGYSRITSLSGLPGAAKKNFRFFLC